MTFYFYDLETTSGSPRTGRIMQFAGQRTDENLEPVGEPDNILVRLSDDVLPEPDAILVHGITPQKTLEEGISEAEFTRYFQEKIATAHTIFVGFNNIRFDDEFMRRVSYRNFYDPYQWHWKDSRSRWDMMDPIRMMRALRPDGMKWPMLDGKPTVKLELMAKENRLLHENAHDALSDVVALIQLTQKFKSAQPKLFDYLLQIRDKKEVAKLVNTGEPFVYTSGKYSSENEKTSVVVSLFKHPRRDSAIIYDLRHDPSEWLDKPVDDLVKHWTVRYGDTDTKPLPIKTMQFNKCPAIAPVGVLDDASKERTNIDMRIVEKNRQILTENPEFIEKLKTALDKIENEQQTKLPLETAVDNQIYDGFWGDDDQVELRQIRVLDPTDLSQVIPKLKNKRLREMVPLYKARNFPKQLTTEEHESWEAFRRKSLIGGENSVFAKFSKRMQEIRANRKLTSHEDYLLTELQLYAESIMPEPED
jgi:exodeoxyribonuclease-1